MSGQDQYLGNPNLKKVNTPQEFTKDQILEYQKCAGDPIYFMETYVRIVSLDLGLVPFKMYDFQKKIVQTIHDNRFTICKLPRQSGKSTTTISYLYITLYLILILISLYLLTNQQLLEIY